MFSWEMGTMLLFKESKLISHTMPGVQTPEGACEEGDLQPTL